MRILLVDSDKDALVLLRGILARKGHAMNTATTAGEAMVYVQLVKYDLILTELEMPGIDGHEFMRWLRSRWDTSDIPIVVLSARKDEDSKARARMNGCVAYIKKPFRLEDLLNIIEWIGNGMPSSPPQSV